MVREFYEACDKAARAKTSETALKHLTISLDNLHPLVAQARARLEIHTALDLLEYFRYSVSAALWGLGGDKDPGLLPFFFTDGISTFKYPPAPRGGTSSLDFRWSKWQDRAESYLPWIGANKSGPWHGYTRVEIGYRGREREEVA
jgi:hypothetical protein